MSKSKTELVREALEKNPTPTPEQITQIAKDIGCTKALVYRVLRKMPKPEPTGIPPSVEPVVKVEEEKALEIIEEKEELPPKEFVEKAKPIEEIVAKLEVGMVDAEDLTYVWKSVNSLFPTKHQRPDKAMEILGKLWVKPANRLIEKYAVANVDLYIAVGVTVLTFAPSIVGMVRERKPKKKEVKSELVT